MQVVVQLAFVRITVIGRRPFDIRTYVPAGGTRPIAIGPTVVVAFPPHLEQQVVGAVVAERGVELEAEPLIGRGGDVAGLAVEYLYRRLTVVVVGVRIRDRGFGGMATLQSELVEIAGVLGLGSVPLPLNDVAGGNGVRLQDQRLAPEGVVSTPAERVVDREVAAADGDELGPGQGPGQDN